MLSSIRRRFLHTSATRRMANRRTLSPNNTTDEASVIDNPCWGSPTECSLSHLIAKYTRKDLILLETPDYIVLNKPPDLRMDGNFPATVQKLLLYWYPPPSLATENNLLKIVSEMKEPPSDNELRHCHQLDYGTSGVLLFARSKQAASATMQAFSARKVNKVYLAIVHGTVEISKEWPVLPKERLNVLQEQETLYRQRKGKKRSGTFQGYLPPPAVFQKWKALHLQRHMIGGTEKTTKRPKNEDSIIELDSLWKQALGDRVLSEQDLNQLVNSSWKDIKYNEEWKELMNRLAKLYNNVSRRHYESVEKSKSTNIDLPKLFRVQGEPDNAFYVFAPLAEVENDFSMRVEPDILPKEQAAFVGAPELDYKPALTRCVVLESAEREGSVQTKVHLEPKTGRRHQLRIHMLIAGTAIVGDATYEPDDKKGLCPRMCLHAHRLTLPVLDGQRLSATAPDPFVEKFVATG